MCLIRKQCSYMVEMCIRCLQVEKKGSECEIIGISKSGSKRTNCCAPWPFVLKRRGQGVRGQNPALMVLADTKSFFITRQISTMQPLDINSVTSKGQLIQNEGTAFYFNIGSTASFYIDRGDWILWIHHTCLVLLSRAEKMSCKKLAVPISMKRTWLESLCLVHYDSDKWTICKIV